MTLMEHLIELRRRIIICCIAVGVAAVLGWFLYPPISHILVHPYNEIASSSIAGGWARAARKLNTLEVARECDMTVPQ